MAGSLFWLLDNAWWCSGRTFRTNSPVRAGVMTGRRMSCTMHGLNVGCHWCDCLADYDPWTTTYFRFNRWFCRGFWVTLLDALTDGSAMTKAPAIDRIYDNAQPSALGGTGIARRR